MPPPTNTLGSFTLFPLLPPEIRDQIFIMALGVEIAMIPPALFHYKKGCWHWRLLPRLCEDEEGYDPTDLDPLWGELSHHLDLLDIVQVFIPLMSVNRAARDITMSWICNPLHASSGIEVREGILTTSFNPARDVLYVGVDEWDDFNSEPYEFERSWEEEGLEGTVSSCAANVRRLAVPSKLLEKENNLVNDLVNLIDLHGEYALVSELLIVVDTPLLDLQSTSKKPQITRSQQRWEYIGIDGGVFRWNKECSGWDFDDGDRVASADDALFEHLGAMHKDFGLEFDAFKITDFMIRFVTAVGRLGHEILETAPSSDFPPGEFRTDGHPAEKLDIGFFRKIRRSLQRRFRAQM